METDHSEILRRGVNFWNVWRERNPGIRPTLRGVSLVGQDLREVNFSDVYFSGDTSFAGSNLSKARLMKSQLGWADLHSANLSEARLDEADLYGAKLSGSVLVNAQLNNTNLGQADISKANLQGAQLNSANIESANLAGANLSCTDLRFANLMATSLEGADLTKAELEMALLVDTNIKGATIKECSVYGVSAWGLDIDDKTEQQDLTISDYRMATITVDDLEIAQFIYLLIYNTNIRRAIDVITSKVVLILGRFSREQKPILNAIRETLRRRNYVPVVFDFPGPASRDLEETVSTLAHLARFIVADLTDARSVPHEFSAIVPRLQVPVQPIIRGEQLEYGMFETLQKKYPWVLKTYRYTNRNSLLADFADKVITPADMKATEIRGQQRLS